MAQPEKDGAAAPSAQDDANKPAGAPRAATANAAQLKREIESGAQGDKVAYPDPGAAPLGTDDEAAGAPADAERERIELARRTAPDAEAKPFEPIQSAPRSDPADPDARRVETSGRFQLLVLGGSILIVIAALLAAMAF